MAMTSLEKVGLLAVLLLGYLAARKLFCYIYNNFIGPRARKIDFKNLGQWALITGSTDGLGKAYARALAKKGCNVILISRTKEKLDDVAKEIELEFGVKTKCIVADFTDSVGLYEHIEKELTGLEIGVLINNVGVSYPYPDYFLQFSEQNLYEQIIKANIVSVTKMCAMIMPGMVERKKGVVINISSLAAHMPSALWAVYSASKIYVDKLSIDLAQTYEKKGLIIQSIIPGPVATKMSKIHRATWMAPYPDEFVASALQTCGKSVRSTGYGPHDLLWGAISGLEFLCSPAAVWLVTKTTENIRRRALKKMASAKS